MTNGAAAADRELRLVMDLSLELRLCEVSSVVKKEDLPMPLSKFWDVYFARAHAGDCDEFDLDERLDCKQSTHRSVLKWARAMDKGGALKLKESKGKKGRTRGGGPLVTAVTRRQHRDDGKGGGEPSESKVSLTAEALEALASSQTTEDEDDNHNDQDSCAGETGSVAVSEAMSAATTTNSVATSAFEYRPTTNLKYRQVQRDVTDREIKSVLKHATGRDSRRSRDGRRVLTSDGVTIVTSGERVLSVWRDGGGSKKGKKFPVESAWFEGGLGGDSERFVMEEQHTGLRSSTASTLSFLFVGSDHNAPLEEAEICSACEQYCLDIKGKDSNGELQIIAFLYHLKKSGKDLNESDHAKRVLFYSKILRSLHAELQKAPTHNVTEKETLKQLHACRSPKFWDLMEPVFRESPYLKDQIKTHIARVSSPWPSDQLLELLLKRDVDLFSPLAADDLTEKVLNLTESCHIMDNEEVREGYPPYVTLGVFPAKSKQRGGRQQTKMDVLILGLSPKQANVISSQIRKVVGCPCSVGKFNVGRWGRIFKDANTSSFAKDGSPAIELKLSNKDETLVKIAGVVKEQAPLQYRRLIVKESNKGNSKVRGDKGLDSRVPQLLPVLEEKEKDPYQEQVTENARLRLQEIYKKHEPEKLKDVDFLLEKYKGKEDKLVQVIEKKWEM